MDEIHVDLFAGEVLGQRTYEPVHVIRLHDSIYRVLYAPGVVYGIAAGDEIRLLAEGEFDVVHRAQNLAVRVYSSEPIEDWADGLVAEVQRLGGRLDGRIRHGFAFTIPVTVGFNAVETVFGSFVTEHPKCLWEFGNVYDEAGDPLGWWPTSV